MSTTAYRNSSRVAYLPRLLCGAGGSEVLPEDTALQVFEWLDWEESVLRPHVEFQDSAGIKQDVQYLQSALGNSSHLVGNSLTLADIVVFATLFSVEVGLQSEHAMSHCIRQLCMTPSLHGAANYCISTMTPLQSIEHAFAC